MLKLTFETLNPLIPGPPDFVLKLAHIVKQQGAFSQAGIRTSAQQLRVHPLSGCKT
jgi:hypothetical protein